MKEDDKYETFLNPEGVEAGQYWVFDIGLKPIVNKSVWKVLSVEPPQAGQMCKIQLIFSSEDQKAYNPGFTQNWSVRQFSDRGWRQVDEDEMSLIILGEI